MKNKVRQVIGVSNKLAMTQQIQLVIKLLQLNTVDLQREIDEKILNNPFLENESSFDYQDLPQQSFSVVNNKSDTQNKDFDDFIEQAPSKSQTLHEYLLWQMKMANLNEIDELIAYTIIDYINDSGFLTITIDELFLLLNKSGDISFQEIFAVLHKIQNSDPIGVGATSLSDCLLIQLEHFYKQDQGYLKAKDIIDSLGKSINPDLACFKEFNQKIEEIKNKDEVIARIITSLNPKPGNIISADIQHEHITPDVIVTKKEGTWVTELNPEINPKIKINKSYDNLISEVRSDKDRQYIKENIQDAKFFIKALKNRNITILNVAKKIMVKQQDFLLHGEMALKPLVLREIAAQIDMHESTISRATNNKYIQTPRGVFELKYFFSSEIETKFGEKISSKSIKEMIKKLIQNEDTRSPLSDAQISENFIQNGIKIARRTITKYRESLGISSSNERRIKMK